MNKADRKHNFAMTLLFAVIIFCVLAASIVLGVIILFPLTYFGVISGADGGDPGSSAALLLLLLVSLLIGAAITLIMSRILQKPFSHFISLTNRMAAGDFKVRLTFGRLFRSHPSFAALADSFNTMAQELENTELLRSDFVNNFSHEFKTPIVSIAGFAKLLRRGDLSEAQQDEYLAIIEEESLRLAAMANNVLALTKIESQTILTDVTEFNLSEQLRSCVLLLEDRWTKKNLTPVLEFDEYRIAANEELLRQVWINLLDNAIKFSAPGSEIVLQITESADRLEVSVTNTGEDIPPHKLDKIWNRFYQADESHSTRGNGVGLAIVKQVVRLHRGAVSVESGGGTTTFSVSLRK